jgi:lycopene beta-cyclase
MQAVKKFDYIIVGAGAAGLLLADALGKDPFFSKKSVLLIDRQTKNANDRTWCFWDKGKGAFDDILYRSWSEMFFAGQQYANTFAIAPYRYKMLRGIDFYNEYLNRISTYDNMSFCQEAVTRIQEVGSLVIVETDKNTYRANMVFNSIFNFELLTKQQKYPVLQQHFLGWFVKSEKPVFAEDQATFMDFSIPQKGNTRFMYVLPFSPTEALVEYTLFSEKLLPTIEYETAIKAYLEDHLNCKSFNIVEKEQGSIPMTCYDFSRQTTQKIIHIGTAGGWAKPSTGFTFRNTYKKTALLAGHLKAGKTLRTFSKKNRFWYYDLLLLDILYNDNAKGHYIFETLFKNRKPTLILKFLDEETSFWEDLKIIAACPKKEFIKAFFNRFMGRRLS